MFEWVCCTDTQVRENSFGFFRRQAWVLALVASLLFMDSAARAGGDPISTRGGRYFSHRVEIPVPAFAQDDARWSLLLLGPSSDTIGVEGCALTSVAMVMNYYGFTTDPLHLNHFLLQHGGFDDEGYLAWQTACEIDPHRIQMGYQGAPSFERIDRALLGEVPVIAQIALPDGAMHFVVVVGKQGWDYLARDPAHDPGDPVYPLHELTSHVDGVEIYRVSPAR